MNVYTKIPTHKVGLILPCYDKTSFNRISVINFKEQFPNARITEIASSALGHCFNVGYQALRRIADKGDLDYIGMLHADCVPLNANWGEILVDEMLATQASIMSVVMPIKSEAGLTSTGVMREEDITNNIWNPIRFTMRELHSLPDTFTHPRLIVNTGCMLIDIRQEWAKKLVFDLRCFVDLANYQSWYVPEDWMMSRQCFMAGGTVYATKKVRAEHYGSVGFPNFGNWGNVQSEGAMEVYLKEGNNDEEDQHSLPA